MRLLVIFMLLGALALPAGAQSRKDKDEIAKLLEAGQREFLDLIEPLDEKQWNFRTPTIRHTVGEEAEHLALSENELQRVIRDAKSDPEAARALTDKQEQVKEILLNPDEPAENFKPLSKLINKSEVLEFYGQAYRKLMRLLESSENLNERVYKHPNDKIGELNGLQWFYYIAYHRSRHIEQIRAVMAHPDFPGRVQSAD